MSEVRAEVRLEGNQAKASQIVLAALAASPYLGEASRFGPDEISAPLAAHRARRAGMLTARLSFDRDLANVSIAVRVPLATVGTGEEFARKVLDDAVSRIKEDQD